MVKFIAGVADIGREGVHHARLRRLGTEVRWTTVHRDFVPLDSSPTESEKHRENLP
ncbi:MAG: hypothetical protein Q7V56_05100 [Gammaproteobacteria bacterium]|nr:hypothetical protein [Gammaproteobacteria bacterium]